MAIPLDVVARGVLELPAGVRIAIECSVRLWRAKRMTATDLDSPLSSVAWQSPTLSRHFEACKQRRNADGPECCAVLSNEDMAMLMNGGSKEHGPAKRRRATSSLTKQDCTPSGLALTPVHPLPEEPNVEHSFEILSGEDMLALMGRGSPPRGRYVGAHRGPRHYITILSLAILPLGKPRKLRHPPNSPARLLRCTLITVSSETRRPSRKFRVQ